MKNILIFGNSHIGALKHAAASHRVSQLTTSHSLAIAFGATTGANGLEMEGSRILATNDVHKKELTLTYGSDVIDLRRYSGIVLVGNEWMFTDHPLNIFKYINPEDENVGPMSASLIRAILTDILETYFDCGRTCEGGKRSTIYNHVIRDIKDIPIVYVPNPPLPFDINNSLSDPNIFPHISFGVYKPLSVLNDLSGENCAQMRSNSLLVRDILSNAPKPDNVVDVVIPPIECMSECGFRVKKRFSKSSVHFWNNGIESDFDFHMNPEYGEIMLLEVLRGILPHLKF